MPEIEIHETVPVLESVEKPDSPLTIYFRDDLKIPSFIQLFALRKEKDRRQAENPEALTSPQDRTFVKPNQADFVKKGKAAMKDIHKLTQIIPDSGEFRFLDLGCTPGGFSAFVLARNPHSTGVGISISEAEGGYPLAIHVPSHRYTFIPGDLTSYRLFEGHQTLPNMQDLPHLPQNLDAIFCAAGLMGAQDGFVNHRPFAGKQLELSQLIISLRHLRQGGTLVLRQNNPERATTLARICQLQSISTKVSCCKPMSAWANTSAFYVVAQEVDTSGEKSSTLIEELIAELRHVSVDDPSEQYMLERGARINALEKKFIEEGTASVMVKDMSLHLDTPWKVQAKAMADIARKNGYEVFHG